MGERKVFATYMTGNRIIQLDRELEQPIRKRQTTKQINGKRYKDTIHRRSPSS